MLATLPLAAVLAAALIAPSTAAACPQGGYCTDSSGTYELVVPPFPTEGIYGQFHDCVWNVHVEFGDGESADYVFEAEKGLSGSHTYPHYGRYTASFTASNGYHKNNPGETCPGKTESFFVYWQSAQEIAEEEALTKAEKEAKEQKEAEEKAAIEAQKQKEREEREARERAARERFGGGTGGSGSEGSSGGGGQTGPVYWRTCRGRIQVHGVGCSKARKVIGRARRKNLYEGGPQEILGFACHLTGTRPAQISCRRGKRRVLAPL
jgi:hypothetical protein